MGRLLIRGVELMTNQYSVLGLALVLNLGACARIEERSGARSHSETCVNGVCSTSSSQTTKIRNTGTTGVGVTIGPPEISLPVISMPVISMPVISLPGVSVPVNVPGGSGGVVINPCSSQIAPIAACQVANANVMMPKHLGCTASGSHAWSCQDPFYGAPPFPVVACSGVFSNSCTHIGSMY